MSGTGKKVADVDFKTGKSIDWEGVAKLIVSDEARKEFSTLRRAFDEVNTQFQTKFSQVEIKRDVHHAAVRVFADAGRILLSLLIVKKLKKIKDLKGAFFFQCLLDNGIVELIGPEEEEDCRAAWGMKFLFKADKENPPAKYTF